MLIALQNGKRITPTPNKRAICPICFQVVRSNCGNSRNWYWVHMRKRECDTWLEIETKWHRNWKKVTGLENCDHIIKRNGIVHQIDISTNRGYLVRLQNTPITNSEILEREEFYGNKMIWILNGSSFSKYFHIGTEQCIPLYPIFNIEEDGDPLSKKKKLILHVQNWNLLNENVLHILKRYGYNHVDPLGRLYKNYFSYEETIDARSKIIKDIEDTFGKQTPEEELIKVKFAWDNRRDCWEHSERSIFMDFGKDYLIWLHPSNRNCIKSGEAIKLSKSHFITKINENMLINGMH